MDKVGAGAMSGPDADLDAGAGAGNAAHERRPLIIYASRTHSQLAQVGTLLSPRARRQH